MPAMIQSCLEFLFTIFSEPINSRALTYKAFEVAVISAYQPFGMSCPITASYGKWSSFNMEPSLSTTREQYVNKEQSSMTTTEHFHYFSRKTHEIKD